MLLITLLAVFVPLVLSRFRRFPIPIVVGEIGAGIIIGQSGFDLVHFSPTLNFLSEFGFAFLMFLSGLEVNIGTLSTSETTATNSKWEQPMPLAVVYFAATVGLALIFGYTFAGLDLARSPILMALILSTTSLGIVVPVLKERGLAAGRYGQALLVGALVSDFATLLLLSVVLAVLSSGFSFELLLFMVLIVAFFAAIRISARLQRIPGIGRVISELSHATAQIRVRGSLALLVIFVVLAESLGVELILGSFLAGVLVSITSRNSESPLPEKLDAIGYGFFIPIFFITVGAKFDLNSLFSSKAAIFLVPLMVLAAYVVKIVPAVIYRSVFTWRESLGLGVLLSSRLSLIIAASSIALGLDLISSAVNSSIILVAIITCTASPLLFQSIIKIEKPVERTGIVIFGTHQLALLLGRRLARIGETITFMSRFSERLDKLPADGYDSVVWDPENETAMAAAGLDQKRAFIAVSNSTEVLSDVCRIARDRYGIPTVIANADDPSLVRQLQENGVGVVQSTTAVAVALESALLYPAAYDILLDTNDNIEVAEVPVAGRSFRQTSLRQIRVPGNGLIVGIRRKGETIVPHGDTVIEHGDILVMFGDPASIAEARIYFSNLA